jgi:hypothetical protein
MNSREKLFLLFVLFFVALILLLVIRGSSFRKLEQHTRTLHNIVSSPAIAYTTLPTAAFDSNLPVPSSLIGTVGSSKSELKLGDDGNLEYFVNQKRIWNLKSPRAILQSPETEVLKEVQMGKWGPVAAVSGPCKLTLSPLAITRYDLPHWTLFGGFEDVRGDTSGTIFLISENRKKRAVLLKNGDIVILSMAAERNSQVVETTLESSLYNAWVSA